VLPEDRVRKGRRPSYSIGDEAICDDVLILVLEIVVPREVLGGSVRGGVREPADAGEGEYLGVTGSVFEGVRGVGG
jgi:hypothetical protein